MPQTQAAPSVLELLRESGDYEQLALALPNDWHQRPVLESESIKWRLLAAELAARKGTMEAMQRALTPYLNSLDKLPFAFAPAVLLSCATFHYHRQELHQALPLAYKARSAASARADEWAYAEVISCEGQILCALAKLDEAVERYHQALALYSEQGRPYRLGLTNLFLGITLNRMGRVEEAHQILERSIKLLARSHDEYSLAHARFQIAQSLRAVGEPETAYPYLLYALETFEKLGDHNLVAVLNELAATLILVKDYESAQHHLQHALDRGARGDAQQLVRSCEVQAQLHLARRQFPAADVVGTRALNLARQTDCKLDEAKCLRTLGRLRLAQKRCEAAEEFLEQALEIAEERRAPLLELQVKLLLAQAVCESNPVEAFKLAAEVETLLSGRALLELKKEAKATRRRLNALAQEHYFILSDANLPSLSEARVRLLKWLWARSLYQAKGNASKAAAILGVTPTYIRRLTKIIPRDLLKPRKRKAKRTV